MLVGDGLLGGLSHEGGAPRKRDRHPCGLDLTAPSPAPHVRTQQTRPQQTQNLIPGIRPPEPGIGFRRPEAARTRCSAAAAPKACGDPPRGQVLAL